MTVRALAALPAALLLALGAPPASAGCEEHLATQQPEYEPIVWFDEEGDLHVDTSRFLDPEPGGDPVAYVRCMLGRPVED